MAHPRDFLKTDKLYSEETAQQSGLPFRISVGMSIDTRMKQDAQEGRAFLSLYVACNTDASGTPLDEGDWVCYATVVLRVTHASDTFWSSCSGEQPEGLVARFNRRNSSAGIYKFVDVTVSGTNAISGE